MLGIKFLVVCKCPGDRDTIGIAKRPSPETHRSSNARDLPGGMLTVGIDSQISDVYGEFPKSGFRVGLFLWNHLLSHHSSEVKVCNYKC